MATTRTKAPRRLIAVQLDWSTILVPEHEDAPMLLAILTRCRTYKREGYSEDATFKHGGELPTPVFLDPLKLPADPLAELMRDAQEGTDK